MTDPSRVVGRAPYVQWIETWIDNNVSQLGIVMVHGPAGIGKSTLLEAIRDLALGAQVAAWYTDGSYMSTPMAWIDYMGFLVLHQSTVASTAPAPRKTERMDILDQISHTLGTQQSILLVDNADALGITGEWLRTQFLPPLRNAPLLIVMASRHPLVEWMAHPFWQQDVMQWPLTALSYDETLQYLQSRDIDADQWGAKVFRQTHGHPLSLALAADRIGKQTDQLISLSQMATLHVLREVVHEEWIPHLEALALVHEADQGILEAITGRELGSLTYHHLLSLSFVQADPQGLRMHDTVRQIFIDDLRQRHPMRFKELRRKALGVLSERRSADDAAIRLKTGAVLLELYRDDLPVGPWLNFSAVHGWSPHSQATLADRAKLHQLLPREPRTRLLRSGTQHELLDALIDTSPASVRVIRDPHGKPLGFWAGVWLSEKTIPLLDDYFPLLVAALDEEVYRYRLCPEALADTCVTVFFCYRDVLPWYSVEQVRGLVLYDALIILGGSVRVWTTSEHPPFRAIMQSIGLRLQRVSKPAREPIEVLVGDKRGKGFLAFLWFLDRVAGSPNEALSAFRWSNADTEYLLRTIHHRETFRAYLARLQFPGDGSMVRHRLIEILTRYPVPDPLTVFEQELLRFTFLDPIAESTTAADRLHISRSTYYRYRKEAISHATALMNRLGDSSKSTRSVP
ncbi:MAG: hypothetical protein M0Z53_15710 [Thermaerobacter sp.]|nr:hypothetical protein [Thermaerobacter sp.]